MRELTATEIHNVSGGGDSDGLESITTTARRLPSYGMGSFDRSMLDLRGWLMGGLGAGIAGKVCSPAGVVAAGACAYWAGDAVKAVASDPDVHQQVMDARVLTQASQAAGSELAADWINSGLAWVGESWSDFAQGMEDLGEYYAEHNIPLVLPF